MVPNGTSYDNYPPFANNGTKTPPGGSPESAKYALGMVPADTFPAEWANYLFHGATAGITRLNADTGSIKKEINTFLSNRGITPDATSVTQLLQAIDKIFTVEVSSNLAPESVRNGQRFFITASAAVTITLPSGTLGDVLYFINQSSFTATVGSFEIPASGTITILYNGNAWQLVSGGKINGTDTTSGTDITTSKWGTARDIKIQDSDGTNTGAAVSVDGSDNATLKLPSTIKASITGNCDGSSGSCTGNAATASALQSQTWINTALYGAYVTTPTAALSVATYTFIVSLPHQITESVSQGGVVRVTFAEALQSAVAMTAISLTLGGRTGVIKSARGGLLVNVVSHKFSSGVYNSSYPYKVWDAYTTLDLMWTGSEWLVQGDSVLCSYASDTLGYTVKANGLIEQWFQFEQEGTYTFAVSFSNSDYKVIGGATIIYNVAQRIMTKTNSTISFTSAVHTWIIKDILCIGY